MTIVLTQGDPVLCAQGLRSGKDFTQDQQACGEKFAS